MGSTRQIFSEDRHQTPGTKTGPCPLVATNTKIHLIIKFFWSDRFTTNRKYFNNREIFETALSELFKKHWKIRTSDENLEDICVLFFCNFSWYLYNGICLLLTLKQKLSSFTFWRVGKSFWSLTLFSRNHNSYNLI